MSTKTPRVFALFWIAPFAVEDVTLSGKFRFVF